MQSVSDMAAPTANMCICDLSDASDSDWSMSDAPESSEDELYLEALAYEPTPADSDSEAEILALLAEEAAEAPRIELTQEEQDIADALSASNLD